MSLLTTLIAPIVQPLPIVTPGKITCPQSQPHPTPPPLSIQTHHIPANPAIIPDHHGPPVLDIIPARLDLSLMRRRENRDIGAKHAAFANRHKTAVQNREVEVRVEAVAERDVAAIVNVEGRLDEDVFVADVADNGFEHFKARGGEGVEALGGGGGGIGKPLEYGVRVCIVFSVDL
jgi:hypothetical protein